MKPHLLVTQLRFARAEFMRGLDGVSDQDARTRLARMNCISWALGHLANQEHRYWVQTAQGKNLVPGLNELVGFGKPASEPPLEEMRHVWRKVTAEADLYLDLLTPATLQTHLIRNGEPVRESIGTMLMRNIYHYWFHLGETYAIREMLGQGGLPDFVGDMSSAAYSPEHQTGIGNANGDDT
jgi:hypothetical protein